MFEELLAAGDAYREAQKEALAGAGADADAATLTRAEKERRSVIASARKRTESILAMNGLSASGVAVSRIATTLEALASYGHANPSPYDGCASDDLEPPGFAALAALAPASPRPRPHPDPAPKPAPQPQPQPEPEPEPAQERRRARDAEQERLEAREQERKREAERERRELDAAIERIAFNLDRAKQAVAHAESALATAREDEAVLASELKQLKGRRREME